MFFDVIRRIVIYNTYNVIQAVPRTEIEAVQLYFCHAQKEAFVPTSNYLHIFTVHQFFLRGDTIMKRITYVT